MYDLFLGNISYTILLAVTAIVVGRILGPAMYGLYTVALIAPSFLFTVVGLGLDSTATRFAARLRSEGKQEEAVSFVYVMSIFGVVIATASSLIFIGLSGWIATDFFNRPELGAVIIPIAMLSVVGQAAFSITDLGMTGLGRFDRAALVQALQGAMKLVVSVGLVLLGFGVAGAVAGYTASLIVTGVLGVAYIAWLARRRLPRGMKSDIKVGMKYGFPIYLSLLASGFAVPAINTALALTVSNTQIGGNSAASTFTTLIGFFTYPISTSLFPLFSQKVEDLSLLGKPYQTSLRYTALLVTPVTTFMIAFSGPLIVTFWGEAYGFGTTYVALYALTGLLAGVGSLAWYSLLNGIGRTGDNLVTTALGSAVSVVSSVALIRVAGVSGAISGQVVGGVVTLAIGTWMVKRRLHTGLGLIRVWKFYVASGLAALLSWPLSWLIYTPELAVAAGALAFVLLFIPLLALFRALDEADIEALRRYLEFSAVISKPLEALIWYYKLALSALRRGP
jgi:stage V sporulation protein B